MNPSAALLQFHFIVRHRHRRNPSSGQEKRVIKDEYVTLDDGIWHDGIKGRSMV